MLSWLVLDEQIHGGPPSMVGVDNSPS